MSPTGISGATGADGAKMMTADGLHQHACVVCQQRKVKCDRLDPVCSNCAKGNVECIYRIPPPPRRRKRKLSEPVLKSRLKKCEELLQRHGIPLGDVPSEATTSDLVEPEAKRRDTVSPRPLSSPQGMGSDPGQENDEYQTRPIKWKQGSLWDALNEVQPQSATPDLSKDDEEESVVSTEYEEDLVHDDGTWVWGGSPISKSDLTLPAGHIVLYLWKIFKENVSPLTKIVHVPTVEDVVRKSRQPSEEVSRSENALLFAILAAAVNSLNENDCERNLGEPRSKVLPRYRASAQRALSYAKFLSTKSLTVLQAVFILLISMRIDYDPPTMWTLSGIALRIGQRMGIHQEDPRPDVAPFDREMRNRAWLQVMVLDSQLGELSGVEPFLYSMGDLKVPLNVDDKALRADMTELPREQEGATEMMFTRIRYEFGVAMHRTGIMFGPSRFSDNLLEKLEEKDHFIDEIEAEFGRKYLRYCDPLIPIHFMVILAARAMICRARLAAHHPRQYKDGGESVSQEERDNLFNLSVKAIEYDCLGHATKILEGFRWHFQNQLPFSAIIYVLNELRRRTSGPEVDKAWGHIEELYGNHPELIKRQRKFFWAIGSFVVGVWEGRERELVRRNNGSPVEVPTFISQLRTQRRKITEGRTESTSKPSANVVPASIYPDIPHPLDGPPDFFQPSSLSTFDLNGGYMSQFSLGFDPMGYSPLDWSAWDEMLLDFERQGNAGM